MACPQKFKKLTLFHRYAKEDEKWDRKKKDRQEKSAEKYLYYIHRKFKVQSPSNKYYLVVLLWVSFQSNFAPENKYS